MNDLEQLLSYVGSVSIDRWRYVIENDIDPEQVFTPQQVVNMYAIGKPYKKFIPERPEVALMMINLVLPEHAQVLDTIKGKKWLGKMLKDLRNGRMEYRHGVSQ